jgi:hypothetical protein
MTKQNAFAEATADNAVASADNMPYTLWQKACDLLTLCWTQHMQG